MVSYQALLVELDSRCEARRIRQHRGAGLSPQSQHAFLKGAREMDAPAPGSQFLFLFNASIPRALAKWMRQRLGRRRPCPAPR
jgi:hypothetical protein